MEQQSNRAESPLTVHLTLLAWARMGGRHGKLGPVATDHLLTLLPSAQMAARHGKLGQASDHLLTLLPSAQMAARHGKLGQASDHLLTLLPSAQMVAHHGKQAIDHLQGVKPHLQHNWYLKPLHLLSLPPPYQRSAYCPQD